MSYDDHQYASSSLISTHVTPRSTVLLCNRVRDRGVVTCQPNALSRRNSFRKSVYVCEIFEYSWQIIWKNTLFIWMLQLFSATMFNSRTSYSPPIVQHVPVSSQIFVLLAADMQSWRIDASVVQWAQDTWHSRSNFHSERWLGVVGWHSISHFSWQVCWSL